MKETTNNEGTLAKKRMIGSPSMDRLCIHSITNKPLPIELLVQEYAAAGVPGITVWREALIGRDPSRVGDLIRSNGLSIVSLVRGGFFVSPTPEGRKKAIEENKRVIREAAALGAPSIVLVSGAHPGVPLPEARDQICAGIEALLPDAEEFGVKLSIEPLHPMYAGDRCAVTDMATANDMAEKIDSPFVGIAVDVYHLWFDPKLEAEIRRAGAMRSGSPEQEPAGKIYAFHVCDWRTPTRDFLNDRGLMGEGCINIPQIRSWVEAAGFDGFIEVEIFSTEYWATDQRDYINKIIRAYRDHV